VARDEEILDGAGRRAAAEQELRVRGRIGEVMLAAPGPGDDEGALTADLAFGGQPLEQL
jgi:hypothetical protein